MATVRETVYQLLRQHVSPQSLAILAPTSSRFLRSLERLGIDHREVGPPAIFGTGDLLDRETPAFYRAPNHQSAKTSERNARRFCEQFGVGVRELLESRRSPSKRRADGDEAKFRVPRQLSEPAP